MAIFKLLKMYQVALQEVETTKPRTWFGRYLKEIRICNINKRIAALKKEAELMKSYKPEHK